MAFQKFEISFRSFLFICVAAYIRVDVRSALIAALFKYLISSG